jgi:transcriptional regulator with XRE-family HTH domain
MLSRSNTFGERLRDARKQRDWTLQRLAERIGCDRSYLSRLESGKSRNPSREFLIRSSAALGVGEEWLEFGTGKQHASAVDYTLDENADFRTALSIILEEMDDQELLRAANSIGQSKGLSAKAKAFWMHVLAPFISLKISAAGRDSAHRHAGKKRK